MLLNGLADNNILDVSTTPNGAVIYAATAQGLSFSGNGDAFITATSGLPPSSPIKAVFATNSNVYLATTQGLAVGVDGLSVFETITPQGALPSQNILGVCVAGARVYVVTDKGLGISTNGGLTFATSANLQGNALGPLACEGNSVYVATSAGLEISQNGSALFALNSLDDSLTPPLIADMFAYNGLLYMGTNQGLWTSNDGGQTFYVQDMTNSPIPSTNVQSVFAGASGLYVGTNLGLAISPSLLGNSFSVVKEGYGYLASNNVQGVFAQGASVYVATDKGLSVSLDGGDTFTTQFVGEELSENILNVYAMGSFVVASTNSGAFVSQNGGGSYDVVIGTADTVVPALFGAGSVAYVGTTGEGLIAVDGLDGVGE
jgi:hypothetical protein